MAKYNINEKIIEVINFAKEHGIEIKGSDFVKLVEIYANNIKLENDEKEK